MNTLTVNATNGSYPIDIAPRLLDDALEMTEKLCVVTDENVWRLQGATLTKALGRSEEQLAPVILPPGEQNKSLAGLETLYNAFSERGLNRHSPVIAFGGGVIGDLSGFAAATYMRGVPLYQIPTTLLAQVDSSVGGKTAINLPAGKNLAGTFYQPKRVLIDTSLLATLPPREMRCGMAEVIKYGAICSKELFGNLSQADFSLEDTIAECCRLKAELVERDEFDTGERMILNFGHTFGHAIETLGGFSRYNHGEAVAIGMVIAACVSEALGIAETSVTGPLRGLLERHGLETLCDYTPDEILHYIALDKKSGSDGVTLVLLRGIGETVLRKTSRAEIKDALERTCTLWMSK